MEMLPPDSSKYLILEMAGEKGLEAAIRPLFHRVGKLSAEKPSTSLASLKPTARIWNRAGYEPG